MWLGIHQRVTFATVWVVTLLMLMALEINGKVP
jgi:hypothetical protein